MTLVMTLIRPEGVWQSVDYRLSNSQNGAVVDDAAPKQLSVLCPPLPDGPKVLLAFTGLGEAPGGKPMMQWIRETIRGEQRFIMPMLEHLRDRLTRDIGRSHLGRFALVVTGGIFEANGRRFYFEINNIDPASRKPRRKFERGVFEVTEPEVRAAGLGQRSVVDSDKGLILNKPTNWQDHLALIAEINRRAAVRDRNLDPGGVGSVSPWCQVSYLAEGETGVRLLKACTGAAQICNRAGLGDRKATLSAGLSVGRSGEDLRSRADLATRLAHSVGSLIVWPYQPDLSEAPDLALEHVNGKLFPLRRANGATYRDYLNLVGVGAVLNSKYRRRTFDFLGSDLAPSLFRRSLNGRAWSQPDEVKGTTKVARLAPESNQKATPQEIPVLVRHRRDTRESSPIVSDGQLEIGVGKAGFRRALLINPPVYDSQFWARWSQPAGLLRLGTYLKSRGYSVDLVDCMKTDSRGYVPKHRRRREGGWVEVERDDIVRSIYQFGLTWEETERALRALPSPDEVWISSVMTYWWESTRDLISLVRLLFPRARVIVGGIYPTLAPEHAAERLGADAVFTGELAAASGLPTDLSLYRDVAPTYAILTTTRGCPWDCHYCASRSLNGGSNKMRAREPEDVLAEIEYKLNTYGIRRFGFYEDNALVLRGHLQRILELIIERGLKLELYAPEGFETRLLTVELLSTMRAAGFEKVHLPFEALRWETNLGWNRRHSSTASFDRALDAAITAGFRPRTEEINAFVLFGLPDDCLEDIVDGLVYVHHAVGSIIPMLFTPVPGTQIYREQQQYLHQSRGWDLQDLNGKFLPFLEYNRGRYPGLRASDYLQFEALMSVLNKGKVLQRSVNLCDDHPASQGFRSAASRIIDAASNGTKRLSVRRDSTVENTRSVITVG